MLQRIDWYRFVHVKDNRPVSLKLEQIAVDLSERVNQRGSAIEVHRNLLWIRFFPIDSDRTAGLGDVARFAPFQRLFDFTDIFQFRCRFQNQLAKIEQPVSYMIWIGIEFLCDLPVFDFNH